MSLNRRDFKNAFLDLAVSHSGRVVSLDEKRSLWEVQRLPSNDVIWVDEKNPLLFTVQLLKALSLGKKTLIDHGSVLGKREFFEQEAKFFLEQKDFDYGVLTSGSTGAPQIHFFTIEQAFENARRHWAGYQERNQVETIIQSLPLQHSFGLVCLLLLSLSERKKLALFQSPPSLNYLQKMNLESCLLNWTPSHLRLIKGSKALNLSFLKILSIGSSQMFASDLQIIKEHFSQIPCYLTYGLTEAGPRVSTLRLNTEESNFNQMGFPLDGVNWKIVDLIEDSPEAQVGRLAIRSSTLSLNLEKSLTEDGFYKTHDYVRVPLNAPFEYVGRDQRVIKKAGLRIHLQTIFFRGVFLED